MAACLARLAALGGSNCYDKNRIVEDRVDAAAAAYRRPPADGTNAPIGNGQSIATPLRCCRCDRVAAMVARLDWERGLLAIWVVGMAVLLFRYVLGVVVVWRISRQARRVDDEGWLTVLGETAHTLVVRRRVVLLKSRQCKIPMTWGSNVPGCAFTSPNQILVRRASASCPCA